jgi:gliding motility-associated transport system permease protein/gliding motility-associatede transport system auxiliary component
MSDVVRIARKELAAFFSSPAAFIFIGVFLVALLFIFFWVDRFFARNIADVRPLFEWMPVLLIFLVSAMTMRMWSEERRAGTVEFLMTAPVKPLHLVLGKFLACLALVGIVLVLTLPLPVTVFVLGPLDWGPVIGGYLATLALASAYIAIGLFVSSQTDNQIVSLIVAALICGTLYVLGSDSLTSLFGNDGGEVLRLAGSGSRFNSIARGVIDFRDIYYYLSIFGVFLALNLYSLESLRWSAQGQTKKHFHWRLAAGLLVANLIAGNLWLGQLTWARADLTSGNIYSISSETRAYLQQLQEPLLIRGYFSAQTHPLLAPLAPRLRDLLKEYEIAGGGRIRVEFIDPAKEPGLESEANSRFGIRPVPFQTSSKYQASVTNSYFNILVQYGDEFQTLGYRDLIEVKQASETNLNVNLRDPEYEITRAIKKALEGYRGSGDIFSGIPQKVQLQAYLSSDDKLPDPLPKLRADLEALIGDYKKSGAGKFDAAIVNPDEGGGAVGKRLEEAHGLRPLAAGLLNPKQFWFHLILKSGDKVEQVPLPQSLDKTGLKQNIEAELKRFRPGALRTVALYTPPSTRPMPQLGVAGSSGPSFQLLENKLRQNAQVKAADLHGGRVPEEADILFVAAPEKIDNTQLFAIDQFLMKGGTVIVAASPFKVSLQGNLTAAPSRSGLEKWLDYHGLEMRQSMVLDRQNAPLPIPVERDVGGIPVHQIQLLDYPFFVDVRDNGLAQGDAPTLGLNQLTLSWAAPIKIDAEKTKAQKVVRLIESSRDSWASNSGVVVPDFQTYSDLGFEEGREKGRQLLGVTVEGQFTSLFAGKPSPLAKDEAPAKEKANGEEAEAGKEKGAASQKDEKATITGVIGRSPESARIILIGSSSFLSDDVLSLVSEVDRTQYLTPLNFAQNLVDWSLEDRNLLALRARGGQFSRTLSPVKSGSQASLEYLNYAVALLGLGLVYLIHRTSRRAIRHKYLAMLGSRGV